MKDVGSAKTPLKIDDGKSYKKVILIKIIRERIYLKSTFFLLLNYSRSHI